MKLKNIFFAVLIAAIAFFSCDKISKPIFPKQANSTLPDTKPDFIDSSATSGLAAYTKYKMLMEVCGGHLCTNCPTGEKDAEGAVKSSGGQVVFMQDEEGFDATDPPPAGAPAGSFLVDYQCVADSTWYYKLGTPNAFPWGMVNREGAPDNTFVLYPNYQDSASKIIARNTQPAVTINIHDSCWTNPRIIGVEFQVTFKKNLTGSYLLATMIVEDSIYDWQDNNDVYELYWHRNILRGAFGDNKGGSPWGIQIPTNALDSTFTSYQTYDFTNGENGKAKNWTMANCYIVAFVYNSQTNATPYQVVQAEMIKVE